MDAFELADLQAAPDQRYVEFIRVAALSVGRYTLPAGAVDGQAPHTEDEVYYVVRGRGAIQVGDAHRPVQAGSVVYVPARAVHRFHDIAEELEILVFFAPAEYSGA